MRLPWGIRGSNAFVLGKNLAMVSGRFYNQSRHEDVRICPRCVRSVRLVLPCPERCYGNGWGGSGSDPVPARERSFIPWRFMSLYDRNGTRTGSARKSGTSINQYDRYGVKTGSLSETSDGYASYDKYGVKTGSYKTSGTTTTHYDKYGSKVGTYRTGSNGVTTSYDKYGRKTGSFKEDSSGRITEYDKYGKKVGTMKQTH